MASQGQKRRDGDTSSTWSSSSTSDSTSTTMFDVTKAVFMTTTTTSEEEESSRQAAQGSNSEIEVNVQQQGPTTSGVTSQSLPGPAGFNVFLPMGRSVPVVFTDQGICIAGYNAPAASMETEDEVTTSTTTTEQQQQQQPQDAPVAGIFQLLPAGSYLPTFVNMEQLDNEDGECDEDETPAEEYNEEEPGRGGESEPAISIVEATVHERETFVRMGPQQGDIMGTMGWPQPASPPTFQQTLLMPPPLSPPMPPPVSQPMYAGMQTGQGYMPQQYAMPPPFGWQAQMMQSQGQAPAYGQQFVMPPQWPTYQPFWPGSQWQLGQSQWLQGPHMPEGSQMMQQQQQQQYQQQIQQEIITDQLQQDILVSPKRRQAPTHSSRQIRSVSLPCRISMEGFSSQTTSLTEVEVQARVGPYPCTVRRVLSTQTSLQHMASTSRCVSVESTHADIADKSPEREGRIDITQVVHMSSDQLPTEATPIAQVTLGTETCPTVHELWNEKALLVPGAANVHVDTPCVTYGTQTVQEIMGPVEVAFGQQTSEPPCRLPSPLPDRVCSDTHIMAHQYRVGRKALDVPQATVDLQTVEEAIEVNSKACGVQATQEHDQLPCAMDETHVIQRHAGVQQPVVGVQIVQQPTPPPHVEVEVQASGGPFEAGHIVSKVHTVLKQEDPPSVAFGVQATEHPVTRLVTLKKLVSDPRVTLAVQTTNTASSQEMLTGHNIEAHSMYRGTQVSSITGASGTVCVDGTTQVSASPLQLQVTQAPYKHTESQAVQTLSLESLALSSHHTTQTISVGQQSEGIQTGMLIHSTSASSLSGLNLQKQRDFNAQHGTVFQASQLPLVPPEIPHHDIEVQCNYEPFVHTTRSVTTVKVGQTRGQADGHREAIVQCNYETFDEEAKCIVTAPPRPSHDAEVQFGRDPVKDFTRDFRSPEQPTYDLGAQCVYEPDREITRATFIAQSRVMHDFEQQYNYGRVDWHARDAYAVQKSLQDSEQQHIHEQKRRGAKITYSTQSVQMQEFGMQHDIPIAISPPPTSTHVLHGMVDMGVGDSRPHGVVEGHRRFPWRPVSHIRSGPSLSSCASSVFMFGNLGIPHLANAGTQAGEIGRQRLSPTFAVSAPRTETASYPCVAVCSRNTVNHPCSLNLSSYPGRLSQAAQTRDAIFQTEEPVAVRASTVDVGARSVSRGPAMRTPLHEAAVQAFAGPPASCPVSPPSSPSYYQGPFGMSPSGSSRCTSPARDASFQTDRLADVRRSPPGGPFQHDFTGKAAEATENLGHEIMIQASTVVPAAGSAWGVPSSAQQHTSIAAMTEVYPCGHLPQVLQMRETPPSPPPLSPPPHSPLPHSPPPCPCLAAYGWPPVVVEHKIGLGGKLADLLKLRKQQGITPEQPSVEDKGTLEGPYVAPVWGSTDGEQDYLYQDGSQAEGSLEEGDYSETGAVVGAASLAPDGMGAPGTVRRSSVETTSNVTRSTKVAAILPEVTVACFLLALLLVLVASAALLSWTTRRHARLALAAQTTKKALHPSNVTYIIPPFSILPHDRALQTIDPSLRRKVTGGTGTGTGTASSNISSPTGSTPPGPGTAYELCTTEFCVKEGQMMRYLLNSEADPCKDFYEYVCGQWPSQQPPGATYADADGALAAEIESRMHSFLSGPEMSSIQPLFTFWTNCNRQETVPQDRALSHVRALGLELPGSRASESPERLMVLAVTLAQEFGLFALLTVELDSDPEGKVQHVVAVDEPELAWGRMKPPLVTTEHTKYWDMLIQVAQPLASLLLPDLTAVQSAAHSFARITMAMTNVSVAHRHISDRMGLYEVHSYQELKRLDPTFQGGFNVRCNICHVGGVSVQLLNGLFGSSQDLRPSSRLLVKAPRFVDLVYTLLATDRDALHQYMVILALLHLSPLLDVPEASSFFLSSLTGEAVSWGTPPRWRMCLRLAERTLPNLMQVAYEQVFKGSPIFDEVMGDIMVDEVRTGLVEFINSLSILDAWSKIIAKIKVRDTKVYTFYPIVLADPKNLNAYVKKLERSVVWEGDIMEYYIRLRGFLAQMKEQDETLNFFLPRWKHSIFDPECVYYPRRDVVYVPVGFFNLTIPTSPGERMFHVPRAGPRLIGCFFRVVLENTGLYKPEGLWWTEATRAAFQESMACLEEKRNQMILQHRGIDLHDVSRRLNLQGLSDVEDNVAVRISVKVFDDRLFTNRYLNRDYRLPGVEHLSSKQLFFIYLARSHCEVPSVAKSIEDIRCSYKSKGRYRTNLALSNSREFTDAFQCAPGTEMNPTTQCPVWS